MNLEAKNGVRELQTQKDRTVGKRCTATRDLQILHEITLPKKVSFRNLSSPGDVKASYNIYKPVEESHFYSPYLPLSPLSSNSRGIRNSSYRVSKEVSKKQKRSSLITSGRKSPNHSRP